MVKSQMRRQDKPVVGYGRQSISSLMAIRTPSRTDIGSPETEVTRNKKVKFTKNSKTGLCFSTHTFKSMNQFYKS